jgi:hypothetical protein
MPQGGGLGSSYIAQRVQRKPLDQTDLRNDMDATLGGGGGIFQKMEAWGPLPETERHRGGAGRPHLVTSRASPRRGVL